MILSIYLSLFKYFRNFDKQNYYICVLVFLLTSFHYIFYDYSEIIKSPLIFPRTKWCGVGNIAEHFNDLGVEKDVDICCREHDFCPEMISPGETKFGIYNSFFIHRLHCECDEKLYECLKKIDSATATIIGNIYFNGINLPCFNSKCKNNDSFLWGKCKENYIPDEKQWYNLPNF